MAIKPAKLASIETAGGDPLHRIIQDASAKTKDKADKENRMARLKRIGEDSPASSVVSPDILAKIPGTKLFKEAQAAHKSGYGRIPLYDKGGDVAIAAGKSAQAAGDQRIQSLIDAPEQAPLIQSQEPTQPAKQSEGAAKLGATIQQVRDNKYETKMNNVKAPTFMPGGEPAMTAPGMPQIATTMPVFDDGGDVDVNDGKHQVAVLEQGEKVLDPEEAEKYRQQKGQTELIPTQQKAEVQPIASDSTQTLIPTDQPKGTPEERKAIAVDKQKAMGQGVDGLKDLGLAAIHENHLSAPKELNQGSPEKGSMESGLSMPRIEGTPAPQPATGMPRIAPPEMHQEQAGGQLIPGAPSTYTKGEQRDFAGMERKAKLGQYDQQIESALNEGTPEGQEKADRLQLAKQQYVKSTPWGSATNHPGVLGKIGHYAEEVGARLPIIRNVVANIPGSEWQRGAEHQQTLGQTAQDTKLATERGVEENKADKTVKSPWEPVTGEQFTHYNAAGAPVQQLYRNTSTGEQSWRAVPNAEGAAPAQTTGAPSAAPTTAAPAEAGYYGDKQQPKFAEKPVGAEGTGQYAEQLKATELRVPKGYDVAKPEILTTDTNATAAEKIKEYNTSVNNAILADRSDMAQAERETAAETRERRAEDRANRKQIGYAVDKDGHTILTNKFDAENNKQAFEPATPGDLTKDRQATRMLNDVQSNVSRYTAAANKYNAAHLSEAQEQKDNDNMAYFLNHSGFYDMDASISAGGHITLPMVTAATEKGSTLKRSEQYKALSPQAKELLDGYISTMSAVPAYQKSLTGIGRSNKEMLDLELANIAIPTLGTTDILRKQERFQQNIDRAAEGFPKLPGLKRTEEVRQQMEHPVPSEGNATYHMQGSKGSIFSNDGTTWYDAEGKKIGKE